MANFGLCADCDKEVELSINGHCSVCSSESTMKRGAISELELAIENKRKRAIELSLAICELHQIMHDDSLYNETERADRFIKALEDYKNG